MSDIGKMLGFDLFTGKDILKNLWDDPKRLILGVDPLSTKMWNGILGRDDKPIVDQMGGPYGGHTISAFGNQDGGTYARAREAGIDTGPSETGHDAAHVIAAMFAGNGLFGQSGMNYAQQGMNMVPQQQQQPVQPVVYPAAPNPVQPAAQKKPEPTSEVGKALIPPEQSNIYSLINQILKGA